MQMICIFVINILYYIDYWFIYVEFIYVSCKLEFLWEFLEEFLNEFDSMSNKLEIRWGKFFS